MKILLCEDIDKLGWLGDVVEVAEGYARNYLIPQRLATQATEGNVRAIAEEKAKRAEQRKLAGKRLEVAMHKVEGAEAVVAAKANEQGHLFGSVTAREIAANLREQGFEIADKLVHLPEHIKEIGTHPVAIRFSAELVATVNVVVVPEKDDSPEGSETEDED
jgi:large subunit ribosomal protein L9